MRITATHLGSISIQQSTGQRTINMTTYIAHDNQEFRTHPEMLAYNETHKLITLERIGSTAVRHANYIKKGRGVALVNWGVMHTLYRFSVKDGHGLGKVRHWKIARQCLDDVRRWMSEDRVR